MFDNTFRELDRLGRGWKVEVPIEADDEGYIDRECPSCQCSFKVHDEDWTNIVSDESVFCAFCGHEADADQWWTTTQLKRARTQVMAVTKAQIEQTIGSALEQDAASWNRRQQDSLIQIRMEVTGTPSVVPGVRPIPADDPMKLKISCPKCTCRYAAVGVAFFCPACGHNAATMMFDQALNGIRKVLDVTLELRHSVPDRDTAEITVRTLVEGALQNAVTAFQRYAEALYESVSGAPAKANAFQSINQGEDIWRAATGKSYTEHLADGELERLKLYFQRRHLLAHTQGIVDEDYINRSGDATYKIGQRIVIRKADVSHCVDLIERLADGLKTDVDGPSTEDTSRHDDANHHP